MSYSPTTDFLSLLRQTAAGAVFERMPGLDYVVAALARSGLVNVSVGQTAPTVNQSTTAWFKPALPSWTAEGVLFLWNPATLAYEVATPALWVLFFNPSASYVFQSISKSADTIGRLATLAAVQRTAPTATTLILPALVYRIGRPLNIVDFSLGVVLHTITLLTADGATIMQRNSWSLVSTADQLSGVTLTASPDLNAWIIAP